MTDKHNTCRSCKTTDKTVEMYGIYLCPNKFCTITGAWWARLEAGYQDDTGNITKKQIKKIISDCKKEIKKDGNKVLVSCLKKWEKLNFAQ